MGKHSKRDELEAALSAPKPARTVAKPRTNANKQTTVYKSANKPTKVRYSKRLTRKQVKARRQAWWAVPITVAMLILLLSLTAVAVGATLNYSRFRDMRASVETDTFYPGITINGEDMSGKTLDQALSEWAERDAAARNAYRIELTIDGDSWLLSDADFGYHSDYQEILESAWAVGRHGTLQARYQAVQKTAGAWARAYTITEAPDEKVMLERLGAIATAASEPGIEATISGYDAESHAFSFVEGKPGLAVDVHELKDALLLTAQRGGGATHFARHEVKPSMTVEALQTVFGRVSAFKTDAKSSSSNRLINLKRACDALNGLRIEPGQVFSYNETLGKRTIKKGYKLAPALSSGTHTMEIGGGICQVSTTLFNAVARAGMEIVKRYPHSIPSTYVSRGLDATVNWPNQDFRFKNTSDYPIYLSARLNKSKQVIVEVYGRLLDPGITYQLKGVTNETYAAGEPTYKLVSSLPTGVERVVESKRSGYRISTYRIKLKDGQEIDRERLFRSTYPSSGGIVEVGR